MINLRRELVEDYSLVVLTFFGHRFASFGQNKTGSSPGIANKKGTLLWDNEGNTLNFCLLETYIFTPFKRFDNLLIFIALKLFLSLFLAKIYNRISGNRFRRGATSALQRTSMSPNLTRKAPFLAVSVCEGKNGKKGRSPFRPQFITKRYEKN
jgi:hypothetical protein